ncbi:MAG: diaminopimelate epimerase [Rhodospirillaceae bacterium]
MNCLVGWTRGPAEPYKPLMNDNSIIEGLPFLKMHGLGNDFVILDARGRPISLSESQVRAIADRRTGVGCDQVLIVEPPQKNGDAFMTVRNADGGIVASCGNGARCVSAFLITATGKRSITLETLAGPIAASQANKGHVTVDMGKALLDWQDIPLAIRENTESLDLVVGPLSNPVAVSMGNPHVVFFVADLDAIDLEEFGPIIETHVLFPKRTNVEVVQIIDRRHVRVSVWERGVGITQACGTGACAVGVAAVRRNLTDREVKVTLDGGDLNIEWREDGHVIMTGPVSYSYEGILDQEVLS